MTEKLGQPIVIHVVTTVKTIYISHASRSELIILLWCFRFLVIYTPLISFNFTLLFQLASSMAFS